MSGLPPFFTTHMRVLTVRQPWAAFISYGWKRIENRNWFADWCSRQRIAIHAGTNKVSHEELLEIFEELGRDEFRRAVQTYGVPETLAMWEALFNAQRGRIVCTVRVNGYAESREECDEDQRPWWVGSKAWRLVELRRTILAPSHPFDVQSPVIRGRLGLWPLPSEWRIGEGVISSFVERQPAHG